MPVVSLSNRVLASIKPKDKLIVYSDKNIKGLVLRVHPSGRKSLYSVYTFNNKRTYRFIGTYPLIDSAQAKQVVKADFLKILNGINPKGNDAAKSETFEFYMNQHIDEHIQYLKTKTKKSYSSLLKVHIMPALKNMLLTEITHKKMIHFKNSLIHMPTTYNRCHEVISSFFNLCITNEILTSNPIKNIKKYKVNTKRVECLSPAQCNAFIESTHTLMTDGKVSLSAGTSILFLLLTGCRLNEALTCMWKYVDYDNNIINLPDSKCGAKCVFIGSTLKTLLSFLPKINEYLFPGRHGNGHLVNITRPSRMILEHANIQEHFTIHHLRHSYISIAANSGLPLNAVQKVIGHASQTMTERYTHTDTRVAATTAQSVENLITSQSAQVVNKIIQSMG